MPDEGAGLAFMDAPDVTDATGAKDQIPLAPTSSVTLPQPGDPPVGGPQGPPASAAGPAPAPFSALQDLAPMSQATLRSTGMDAPGKLDVASSRVQDYAAHQGARFGVPFDEASGIPLLTRLRVELQRNKESQFKALQHIYGDENVRLGPKGRPIVTTFNALGKPTDIVVDPEGPDPGDLMKLAANAPEIVVSALLTKGMPVTPGIMGALRSLGVMAASAEGTGAVKDILARELEGVDVKLKEVFTTRSGMVVGDVVFGAGLGLLAKSLTKAITPMGSDYPELVFEGGEARNRLIEKFGLGAEALPQTIAERTGNTILARAEARGRKIPGSSRAFDALMAERRSQMEELQNVIQGSKPPLPDEALGQQALSKVGGIAQTAESDIERAKFGLASTAESEIKSGVATATGTTLGSVGAPVSRTQLGAGFRAEAIAKRSAFDAESAKNYGEVYQLPGMAEKSIEGAPLAKDAQTVLDKLPTDFSTEKAIAYDQYGGSREAAKTVEKKMTEFIPSGVLGKLKQLASSSGPWKLQELIAMRNEVSNDIAQGEAIPGFQTKYLSAVRDLFTARIKTGLNEVDPSGQALKLWTKANNTYAENVKPFHQRGISEIYRDPEQGNWLGDSALVSRGLKGQGADDIYTAYKNFFGPDHPLVKLFRRSVADDVLGLHELEPTINAGQFLSRLKGLFADAPDLARETFGPQAAQLKASALALKGASQNLDAKELSDVIASGRLSSKRYADLIAAQDKKDALYGNEIVRLAAKGNVGPEAIRPSEFVNRFAFKADPTTVKEVLLKIGDNPANKGLIEDLRLSTLSKVFTESRDAQGNLSGAKLGEFLSDSTKRDRLAFIAGADTVASLSDISKFLAPTERMDKIFGASGSWSATGRISQLLEHGDLKYVKSYVKDFVLASVYLSPKLRNWASNTAISREDAARVFQSIVASEPFVRNLLALEGDRAKQAASDLHDTLSNWATNFGVEKMNAPASSGPSRESIDRYFDIIPGGTNAPSTRPQP